MTGYLETFDTKVETLSLAITAKIAQISPMFYLLHHTNPQVAFRTAYLVKGKFTENCCGTFLLFRTDTCMHVALSMVLSSEGIASTESQVSQSARTV